MLNVYVYDKCICLDCLDVYYSSFKHKTMLAAVYFLLLIVFYTILKHILYNDKNVLKKFSHSLIRNVYLKCPTRTLRPAKCVCIITENT